MIAVVWHFWIGLFLSFGVVATLLAVAVGYIAVVERQKHPKKP